MRLKLERLQPLGRSLMLPIAVLPVAGLLLRLGQPDLLGIGFVAAAGEAIFAHLGLLFAIGVAVGLARENHGAAGLAGAVAFLVTTEGGKALLAVPPEALTAFRDAASRDLAAAAWKTKEMGKLGVPAGIASGLVAGWLYNRYSGIRLPEYLAFFGGRRFVPIAAGCAGLAGAALFGFGYPALETGIDGLSRWVVGAGPIGLFVYGLLNRLLLITGLHHILNNVAWFIIGDYAGATGDLQRFFAGDPTAGGFMAGFFPVMMFGLPAACLAMYRAAPPARRRGVAGLYLSLALTSLLTGVTEPIEFTFMFLAPLLYVLHAVLTGLSMAAMDLLGVKLGFGFSAGLFDYLLNFGLASRPLVLLPLGLAYFAIYYGAFAFCIRRFGLLTPGREAAESAPTSVRRDKGGEAGAFVTALGGASNLRAVDACTTRLRLELNNLGRVDDAALKSFGARGLIRVGDRGLQVVLGPQAERVSGEIRAALTAKPSNERDEFVTALGGAGNVLELVGRSGRWRAEVVDMGAVDFRALDTAAARGWTQLSPRILHLLR